VLGPVTLAKCVVMLRAVFSAAVADGVCARNPVQAGARLSLPPVERVKFVPLTVGQVRAWAAHAPRRVQAMIVTQAALGLRISELRSLRVPDVDFLRRDVHIGSQLDPAGRRAPLKTARSRRTVPLPAVAADALAAHLAEFGAGRDGLIFTAARGGPWAASRPLWMAYHGAAVAAGLPDGTSSHDLRHHYASVLLAAGESVHVVAERLGDTPALVLDTYGHVMPDQEDRTRTAVDRPGPVPLTGRRTIPADNVPYVCLAGEFPQAGALCNEPGPFQVLHRNLLTAPAQVVLGVHPTSPPPTTVPGGGGYPLGQLFRCGGPGLAGLAVDGRSHFVAGSCFDERGSVALVGPAGRYGSG
jgi:site-specific recombinase XerD